jgi:hypothetical protein
MILVAELLNIRPEIINLRKLEIYALLWLGDEEGSPCSKTQVTAGEFTR